MNTMMVGRTMIERTGLDYRNDKNKETQKNITKNIYLRDDYPAKKVIDTRLDAWRSLVLDYLNGRCLDIHSGYGRRSFAIAELVDSVFAVEQNESKIEVLNDRSDFKTSGQVVPIQASDCKLPFSNKYFDTIIGDYTGRSDQLSESKIHYLDSLVKDNGSVLLLIDGRSRKTGFTGCLGLDQSSPSLSINNLQSTLGVCKKSFSNLQYNTIKIYALWPTADDLSWVYEVGKDKTQKYFVEDLIDSKREHKFWTALLRFLNNTNALHYLTANFLIVASNDNTTPQGLFPRSVLKTGRARSISFDYDSNGSIESISKIPNRHSHSKYNERETRIINELYKNVPEIRDNLPKGEIIDSKLGKVRKEKVVDEQPLSGSIDKSFEDIDEALQMGVDWLTRFQGRYRDNKIEFKLRDYITNICSEGSSINYSKIPKYISTFETPVHGDFIPQNIFVDESGISTVIDWEYGSLSANPIIDVAFYISEVISDDETTIPQAMVQLISGDCQLTELGRDTAREYCNQVGISLESFFILMPLVYIHRINVDSKINSSMNYTGKQQRRFNNAVNVWREYGILD